MICVWVVVFFLQRCLSCVGVGKYPFFFFFLSLKVETSLTSDPGQGASWPRSTRQSHRSRPVLLAGCRSAQWLPAAKSAAFPSSQHLLRFPAYLLLALLLPLFWLSFLYWLHSSPLFFFFFKSSGLLKNNTQIIKCFSKAFRNAFLQLIIAHPKCPAATEYHSDLGFPLTSLLRGFPCPTHQPPALPPAPCVLFAPWERLQALRLWATIPLCLWVLEHVWLIVRS